MGQFVSENVAVGLQRVPVFSYDGRKHLCVFISHIILYNQLQIMAEKTVGESKFY